jgi:hypothetical protein
MDYDARPDAARPGRSGARNDAQAVQCVPYARDHSGIKIFGDAYTWWDKAAANIRASLARTGRGDGAAQLCRPDHGHLAVVRQWSSAARSASTMPTG